MHSQAPTQEEQLTRLNYFLNKSNEKYVFEQKPGSLVYLRRPIAEVKRETQMWRRNAAVVVLGDIGRSPRMCNHALSLATQLNYRVYVVGYLDTLPDERVDGNEHISYVALSPPPESLARLPDALAMPIKFAWTLVMLVWALLFRVPLLLSLVFMQNPPAIPANFACWLAARIKRARFVIDWHNYMWSVLRDKYKLNELTLPRLDEERKRREEEGEKEEEAGQQQHKARRLTKEEREQQQMRAHRKGGKKGKEERKSVRRRFTEWTYRCEGYWGGLADAGLCVTRAMRSDLQGAWGVPAATFYDRPPAWKFQDVSVEEQHAMWMRLAEKEPVFAGEGEGDGEVTRFTRRSPSGEVSLRDDRPLLLVSSTSWTEDEDFQILLDALVKYNNQAKVARGSGSPLPSLVVVITGRGPMKAYYMERLARISWQRVAYATPWLEPADYPRMMAAADLGVCLHTSTSALDLPMKVVDMFGAGTPVLAKRFACIGELVTEENGRLFDTPAELADQLVQLVTGWPGGCEVLSSLRDNLAGDGRLCSWEENWEAVCKPILAPPIDPHLERVLAEE